jgi:cysteinyl-tRNA synthetase, unknown class
MSNWQTRLREVAEGVWIIMLAAWVLVRPILERAWGMLVAAFRQIWAFWRNLMPQTRRRALIGAASVIGLMYLWTWRDVPGQWLAYMSGHRPLMAASTWYYQLDKADVNVLANNPADVIVIDYATPGGKVPLTAAEVTRLKTRPDGRKRFVIAYMSVGEAESYRFYFKQDWKTDPPDWLGIENCSWPGAYKVTFWHDTWKDIVWRGRNAYMKKIIAAGFDGVYLDRVDIYDQYPDNPDARDLMIKFVTDLSATAKKLKPGFFVIPQNADDLLQEPAYRAVIDGLGREDLLYGVHGTGTRNAAREIEPSMERLNLLRWEWKPIFAVEYVQTKEALASAMKEMTSRGLVGTIQARGLDGTDPLAPVDLKKDVGTSEYTKANCTKENSW